MSPVAVYPPNSTLDYAALDTRLDVIEVRPGRNALRNGDMSVAQRGNGPFTANGKTIDGYPMDGSGGTRQVDRVATTLGAGMGANGAGYALRSTVTGQAAVGDYERFIVMIEGVRTFAGQQVTLSFLAATTSGTPKIGVMLQQYFGTGGSPSGTLDTAISAVTISTTATRYTVTFTVPSIVGKTLGTAGDYLAVILWVSAGTTYAASASAIGIQNSIIDITDVQLEAGPIATPFERLSLQAQLAWCQRYFWRYAASAANTWFGFGFAQTGSTITIYVQIKFPVQIRSAPSLTPPTAANFRAEDGAVALTLSAITLASSTNVDAAGLVLTVAGATGSRPYIMQALNTNALLDFSAEL